MMSFDRLLSAISLFVLAISIGVLSETARLLRDVAAMLPNATPVPSDLSRSTEDTGSPATIEPAVAVTPERLPRRSDGNHRARKIDRSEQDRQVRQEVTTRAGNLLRDCIRSDSYVVETPLEIKLAIDDSGQVVEVGLPLTLIAKHRTCIDKTIRSLAFPSVDRGMTVTYILHG